MLSSAVLCPSNVAGQLAPQVVSSVTNLQYDPPCKVGSSGDHERATWEWHDKNPDKRKRRGVAKGRRQIHHQRPLTLSPLGGIDYPSAETARPPEVAAMV